MTKRVFHRSGSESWDHPEDQPRKRYGAKIRRTRTEATIEQYNDQPCSVCSGVERSHPLDAKARDLIAQGAPGQAFEELRKQGWVEWSSPKGRKA
jgi:hypothetical protein